MSDGRDGHIWSVVESDIPNAGHVVIEIVNVITIFTIRIRQNTETLMLTAPMFFSFKRLECYTSCIYSSYIFFILTRLNTFTSIFS